MRTFQLLGITLLLLILSLKSVSSQAVSIRSGEIFTLKSNIPGKVLDVKNASLDNEAAVQASANTGSDAQRWIAKDINKNVYTFTNVASGKLLHSRAGRADADKFYVDQHDDTGNDDVKWTVKKAGNGQYYLQPVGTELSLEIVSDDLLSGPDLHLGKFSGKDIQKWSFDKQAPQVSAPTAEIADKVFEAWYTQFKVQTGKGFWGRAEMMEVLLDAYEVTKNAKYIQRFDTMYNNFIANNKADWMYNKYNDDITWAVLFCVRGYLLTGNKIYLQKGKEQFDEMYARAFTNSYGGGLIWYETKTSKNACINGPAIVACCYLAQATGDSSYYDKAIALYSWSKLYLLNARTGKVNDNIDIDRRGNIKTSTWSSTYNQGTYLGAATMLYKYTKEKSYLEEAQRIAQYTRDSMYNGQVIDNEDGGDDLPGFKGIFARYARMYTTDLKKKDLVPWLLLNAKVAYNNRNSQDLIQTKWGTRTGEQRPKSDFGCSTAVSLLINCLPFRSADPLD